MSVDRIIDGIIEREGGYVDHPLDRGGPTHWGVTEAAARLAGYNGPMRYLPRALAVEIYRDRYVVEPGFDDILRLDESIGEEVIDTGVNMGPQTATRMLQRCLNALNDRGRLYADLIVDGDSGPVTLDALRSYLKSRGPSILARALNCVQGEAYIALAEARPEQEAFLYGWLRTRVGV